MYEVTNNTSTFISRKQFSSSDRHHAAMTNATTHEPLLTDAQRQEFIDAMSVAVTGVNLITTDGRGGRYGVTVSAMSSVSADPPMLLVCINRRSPARFAILSNRVFCVNVLSTRQRHLADSFAGKAEHGNAYDFSIGQWNQTSIDVPRLADAASSFDCVLEHAYQAGSHTIFVGRVTAANEGKCSPLLYTKRSYGSPCSP